MSDDQIQAESPGNGETPQKPKRGCRQRLLRYLGVLVIFTLGVAVGYAVGTNDSPQPETDPAVSAPSLDPPPNAEPEDAQASLAAEPTETASTDLNTEWQAKSYEVIDIQDASFGVRTRHVINLVAPEAKTREERLATLMAYATHAYRQREIEDAASVRLWASPHAYWLLAQVDFSADRCGWVGDDCGESHWHEAQASAAVFTEEQLRIHVLERASAGRYLEPEFAMNAEGHPLSEAGWACYEPVDVPAEGACYTDLGLLWEDTDQTSCQQLELLWVTPDEEWGELDYTCAEEHHNQFIASQLAIDLEVVALNYNAMYGLFYADDTKTISIEIPPILERQQDLERSTAQ